MPGLHTTPPERSGRSPFSPFDAFFYSLRPGRAPNFAFGLEFSGAAPAAPVILARMGERWAAVGRLRKIAFQTSLSRLHWASDPEFSFARHFQEAQASVGEVLDESIPFDRPPWRLVLNRKPATDTFELIFCTHHCLLDAVSVRSLLCLLLSARSDIQQPRAPVSHPRQRPAMAIWKALMRMYAIPSARTAFEAGCRGPRHMATVTVPLAELQKARQSVPHSTVNDVYIAAVAGAMRRVGEQSSRVRAIVPVDLEPGARGRFGNPLGLFTLPLPTRSNEPAARLHHVTRATRAAKVRNYASATAAAFSWAARSPLRGWLLRLFGNSRYPYSVLCSNVMHLPAGLELGGASVISCVATTLHIRGLALMLSGVNGAMTISVLSGIEKSALVDELAQELRQEIRALSELADGQAPLTGGPDLLGESRKGTFA